MHGDTHGSGPASPAPVPRRIAELSVHPARPRSPLAANALLCPAARNYRSSDSPRTARSDATEEREQLRGERHRLAAELRIVAAAQRRGLVELEAAARRALWEEDSRRRLEVAHCYCRGPEGSPSPAAAVRGQLAVARRELAAARQRGMELAAALAAAEAELADCRAQLAAAQRRAEEYEHREQECLARCAAQRRCAEAAEERAAAAEGALGREQSEAAARCARIARQLPEALRARDRLQRCVSGVEAEVQAAGGTLPGGGAAAEGALAGAVRSIAAERDDLRSRLQLRESAGCSPLAAEAALALAGDCAAAAAEAGAGLHRAERRLARCWAALEVLRGADSAAEQALGETLGRYQDAERRCGSLWEDNARLCGMVQAASDSLEALHAAVAAQQQRAASPQQQRSAVVSPASGTALLGSADSPRCSPQRRALPPPQRQSPRSTPRRAPVRTPPPSEGRRTSPPRPPAGSVVYV
eukprot:TRINITY_DN9666_c0_g1_i1.p2 TRINITY_DN9666_c0_g1~~TRINITY_DN9666_c0_g1_i1.p2  ORF type:complete len:473 (+),score=146.59 TRINITY_DN9666_c0_g1_i1:78-1496(+)